MSRKATWSQVKGTLIHRCVLACAGKWLTVRDASSTVDFGDTPEPHFVAEARWIAQVLSAALANGDYRLGWSLIDSGGPAWPLDYRRYTSLDSHDQMKAVADLEYLSATAATAVLDMAREDRWEDMQTEVSDPFARLAAYTPKGKRAANWRVDLLAHRGRRIPLVADLKTGIEMPDIDTLVCEVADRYGREVATIHDSRVACRVLGINFEGECRWSDPVLARPIRRTG